MIVVLIGLGLVGIGLYNMFKDQDRFNKQSADYLNSIQETLNNLKKNDD